MSQNIRTERLLNLVFVLLASRQPVTRRRLRDVVEGYEGISDEAFERKFERDKEELRGMGVPIETVSLEVLHDDEIGYRIRQEDYALPPVTFTSAEMSVLAMAASAWDHGVLEPSARSALRKLEATGELGFASDLVEPVLRTTDQAFPHVLAALESRRAVRFDYRRPDQREPTTREVEPWGLVSNDGRWYLIGHDRQREAVRVFRLARIDGPVTAFGPAGTVEVPEGFDATSAVRRNSQEPSRDALLRIRVGAGNGLRRRAIEVSPSDEPGYDTVRLAFQHENALAPEIAGYADAVIVLTPPELRSAVRDLLTGALAAHEALGGGPAGRVGGAAQ